MTEIKCQSVKTRVQIHRGNVTTTRPDNSCMKDLNWLHCFLHFLFHLDTHLELSLFLLTPFCSFSTLVNSLMGLTCVSLFRPLVYMSQVFLPLAASLSGLFSKWGSSVSSLRGSCVLTFISWILRFSLLVLYLCCEVCLPAFELGLNVPHCSVASLCPPASELPMR